MAINKTINKRTNTHGAMRNCIEYVLRQDKTNECTDNGHNRCLGGDAEEYGGKEVGAS